MTRRMAFAAVAMGSCTVPTLNATGVDRWLRGQYWAKQRSKPVIALGSPGDFDDMHVFAPCVGKEDAVYFLWYSASRGEVANRVYRVGLAISADALGFRRSGGAPVFEFGDGRQSVLTPTVLRDTNGDLVREDGKLRMWFTAADLTVSRTPYTLHTVAGVAPDRWGEPSRALLSNCYSPTIIKEADGYRMWYSDVSMRPWVIRHAFSKDGLHWHSDDKPAITADDNGPGPLVHYPEVLKHDGLYFMWYSSRYWWEGPRNSYKTAINFAISTDGLTWRKHPDNPVMRPDPDLPWEAYFNSSHCLIRLENGSWRMWYAGRTSPPWVNQYASICTASWRPNLNSDAAARARSTRSGTDDAAA